MESVETAGEPEEGLAVLEDLGEQGVEIDVEARRDRRIANTGGLGLEGKIGVDAGDWSDSHGAARRDGRR